MYASEWLGQLWRNTEVGLGMSSISVLACISGSTSTLYLELSSGILEASSPVNSFSQKLFQTILSDSQDHPHSGPLVYTWCHLLYDIPRHLSALYHTYNTPKKPLVLTTALVLQRYKFGATI